MNDELDPEQERIRALLADLGSAQAPDAATMPPEVSARLDETLAGLVAERSTTGESEPSNVVPLRRRWARRGALAAAAVIVVGVGGVAVGNLGGFVSPTASDESAAGGASDSKAESQDSGPASAPEDSGQAPNGLVARDVPQLTAATFGAQVTSLVESGKVLAPWKDLTARQRQSLSQSNKDSQANQEDGAVSDTAKGGCPGPTIKDGSRHTTVLYDGSPAALVVHPARGGESLVEAWTCTGAQLLDSARVPVTTATSGGSAGQTSPGDPGLGSPTPTP